MTTVDDVLCHLGGVPVLTGIPFSGVSKAIFCDPSNGSDSNNGETPAQAFASVTAAYAQTTSGNNDVVFFIHGATRDTLTAALTWSNSYTHLVGINNGLPGMGSRCGILGGSTTDLTSVLTVSGTGCLIANMGIKNEADANVASGAVVVSGARNVFMNCEIAGMLSANPAGQALSYSLAVSGAECYFKNCWIGADTINRTAANADLVLTGSKLIFDNCRIISTSSTAGHFAVKVGEIGGYVEFKDCVFFNDSTNWAQLLTDAFNVTATATHHVLLRGQCLFVGYTGVGDTVSHIYGAGNATDGGMFLATNPTG
jgi:hypothetical protein